MVLLSNQRYRATPLSWWTLHSHKLLYTPALVADATHQPISTFERACRELKDQLSVDDGVERFERQRANTSLRRWINRTTGMYHLHGELDPQSGATLFGAIDTHTTTIRKHPDHGGTAGERVPIERACQEVCVSGGPVVIVR